MAARILLVLGLAVWALIATLVGLGFLTWSAYAALLTVTTPPWAALVVAAGLFVVALILTLVLCMRPRRRRAVRGDAAASAAGGGSGDPREAALYGVLGAALRNPQMATLAALGVGVAVGVSPRLRRMLRALIG